MHHAQPTDHTDSLLIELLTEELPPKALPKLGQAFAQGIIHTLQQKHLLDEHPHFEIFATPRRLAVLVHDVPGQAPDQNFKERLMPVTVGVDESGQMTEPLRKRLEAKGWEHLGLDDLHREQHGKQEFLFAVGSAPGATLQGTVQEAIEYALDHLPIPKVMRYQLEDGQTSVRFVRPAHGLVVLWGDQVLEAEVLGLKAGRETDGHRFMASGPIRFEHANEYESTLLDEGKVVVSFDKRREQIATQLQALCTEHQAVLSPYDTDDEVQDLLDEVTALVEHPTVYVGSFEPEFLEVPAECLILAMRLHQRYFPLFDAQSKQLTHRFLIVSNMQLDNPTNIIEGNERVVRPRLADARFFYETDRQLPLHERVESLHQSVYHNKLGSQYDRVQRLRRLSTHIAQLLGADEQLAARAAVLAKADLNTQMVGEFPELQGIIGGYYAKADGEPTEVCTALQHQYALRIQKPVDQAHLIAAILFIAERIDTLVGIWGIGLAPTGERDPYALRRAALGLISAYEQLQAGGFFKTHQLDLTALLEFAAQGYDQGLIAENTIDEVRTFIYERYRNALVQKTARAVVEAVLSTRPPLEQVPARIAACQRFAQLPQAESLAATNKRISNILQKAPQEPMVLDQALLKEPAELALAKCIDQLAPQAQAQFEALDFTESLSTMAQAKDAVDNFFDEVMVMDEDLALRHNRLALLAQLYQAMNLTADISKLAE